MAFTIPNEADAFHANQAEPDAVDFAILAAALGGDGVVTGCEVSAQGTPDMTVAVAEGQVTIGGTLSTVSAGNVTITTAHASNPRIDLIVVDNTGAKSATAGTAAAEPVCPAIPANSVVLAMVYVPATDTTIAANQITDKRCLLPYGATIDASTMQGDDATRTTSSLSNLSGLSAPLISGVNYGFESRVLFTSATTTVGLKLGLTCPAFTYMGANAMIPIAADGASGEFQGWITSSGDAVTGTGVQAAATQYLAELIGHIRPSGNGTLQIQAAAEINSSISAVVPKQGSYLRVWKLPP